MVQRYFFELAYNGTDFFGWQIQPREISVQEKIEDALTKLNSNSPIKVVGCGRTDTGVHASNFFLHLDFPVVEDEEKFLFKLNRMLPNSIAISKIFKVKEDAHARFHATARTYRYFINRKKDPFSKNLSYFFTKDLDVEKMNKASAFLLGKQDFTSLAKHHTDVKTNICTVSKAVWTEKDNQLYFEIKADRFLRNMVRSTVGTLLEIGLGKIQVEDMQTILDARNRAEAKTSAPACGLFLYEIEYPWKDILV